MGPFSSHTDVHLFQIPILLMAAGAITLPSHLTQFMTELFPPGEDKHRELYQRLSGTSTPSIFSTASTYPKFMFLDAR